MNARDVSSPYAQARKGITVERLDHFDEEENCWREAVVQNTKSAPVTDVVAFRVNFADWLSRLLIRDRRVAWFLALGNRTIDAARKLAGDGVVDCPVEAWKLANSWAAFRGDDGSTARIDPVAA